MWNIFIDKKHTEMDGTTLGGVEINYLVLVWYEKLYCRPAP
jgi:hypothetical protein